MKLEMSREKLVDAIGKSERITGKNLTLPVLSCVLLIATKDNRLTVRATNLDIGIEITLPVKVEQEGTVAIPGGTLYNLLSNVPVDTMVKLELVSGNLSVSTPTTKTLIKTLPFEDFPTIPVVSEEQSFVFGAEHLVRGLKSVWYSASVSSIKPELSSVYIYQDEADLVFAATDSFRLAEKKVPAGKDMQFERFLIPYKNIPDIVKILDEQKGEVTVCYTQNQISFLCNNLYLTSRIINGSFPDYRQIIPKSFTTEVVLQKQDVVNALKVSNIFSDKFNQVNIKVDPGASLFEVTSRNSDVGENKVQLQGSLSGEALEINFNYKYVIDCFQSITTDSVIFKFNGLGRPMIIQGVSDPSFTYLVMPMNK